MARRPVDTRRASSSSTRTSWAMSRWLVGSSSSMRRDPARAAWQARRGGARHRTAFARCAARVLRSRPSASAAFAAAMSSCDSARHRATCGCLPGERDLERGVGERIERVLRQQAEAQRALARRPCPEAARPSRRIVPDAGGSQSGERGEQRRLARAVRADDDPVLAGTNRERERACTACVPAPRVLTLSHATSDHADRRSRKRKIGTPASAVSTPTGSCAGRDDGSRERVGDDEQRAAGERGGRQQDSAGRCR